jgi:hypothetical protein
MVGQTIGGVNVFGGGLALYYVPPGAPTSALNGQPTLPLPEFLPTCREKLPRLYR